jgi:hypothetical protein
VEMGGAEPAAAALSLSAVVTIITALVGAGSLLELRETQRQRDLAQGAQSEAERERQRVADLEALAQFQLYINRIVRAPYEWKDDNVAQADQLLQQCPEPLRRWEWHYFNRLCHSKLLTLKGHTAGVQSVCYSPDGTRLATAGSDKTVKVWDATPLDRPP